MPHHPTPAFRTLRHNHAHCISTAIAAAEKICRRKGLRFTRIRRRVLELIWASHRPAPAYDLLQQLRQEKRNAEPPTVYRALDFLLENRLVHKIETLSAYVGCARPQHQHLGLFLICGDCNQVAELDDAELNQMIQLKASRAGLAVARCGIFRQTLEITGRCPRCQR